MYVSVTEMLKHASTNNYAVPAPNCPDFNTMRAALMAAQEEHSAVLIDISPRQMNMHIAPEVAAAMVCAAAEPLDVPVALQLDHGIEFEDICRCIKAGYTSVMVDSSSLPFEENVRRVSQIVSLAHAHGVSVEAELGHVGQAAAGDGRSADMYTKVDMAVEFIERTGCDALAVAIGTAHGNYPKDFVPKLDFERLHELKQAVGNYPLVLHGGSGAGDENFKKAVEGGINKVNLWTDYSAAYVRGLREELAAEEKPDYMLLSRAVESKASDWLRHYMRLFGSSGRYRFGEEKLEATD